MIEFVCLLALSSIAIVSIIVGVKTDRVSVIVLSSVVTNVCFIIMIRIVSGE